ncbi:MAG: adenylate/guanylate cyclase domain-containing protein [Acidimicrobiia bacterium]|nr:adenylate/guanylate cyclase domain-containing protein [Acidimicrobiia bacterium]
MSDHSHPRFRKGEASDYWHDLMTGEGKGLDLMSRVFRRFPTAPRCKLCQAPFSGPYAPLFWLAGFRRWKLNAQICRYCVGGLQKEKGGTEVAVSMLFADVRGSTSIAEHMTASEYSSSLDRFFSLVFEAVDSEDGVIDNIVGDGVMAFWVPGFVGERHATAAVAAGRNLVAALVADSVLAGRFPVGVGVHTGQAFAGVVGETGSLDFTILGDVPNTTARLGSAADAGELALSDDIVQAAGVATSGLERRILELKGKAQPFPAWIEKVVAA